MTTSAETAALLDSPPAEVPAASPSIADGVERSLDPRAVTLARIGGWIVTAAITSIDFVALLILLLVADNLPGWAKVGFALLWVAVTATLAWFAHWWPGLDHRHASYRVDEEGIEIRKGVFWRHVIRVPRSRVQHTDVSQGPLERSHGLGTLVIYTAGTDHAQVNLSGLDHGTALRIRDHLLPADDSDAG
jgi:uncharacterized protein